MNEGSLIVAFYPLQRHFVMLTIPIALLYFLFIPNPVLLYGFAFYYLLISISYGYVYFMETKLFIQNERRSVRLFPNETGTFSVTLENRAPLPIVNGKCLFCGHPMIRYAVKCLDWKNL
jgi:hypothetical protein